MVKDDANHQLARAVYPALTGRRRITTTLVLAETYTWLRYHVGFEAALTFADRMLQDEAAQRIVLVRSPRRDAPGRVPRAYVNTKVLPARAPRSCPQAQRGPAYVNTTVFPWYTSTRSSTCQATARASTTRSTCRPMRRRSSRDARWLTRSTSCSMMGPASSSSVT